MTTFCWTRQFVLSFITTFCLLLTTDCWHNNCSCPVYCDFLLVYDDKDKQSSKDGFIMRFLLISKRLFVDTFLFFATFCLSNKLYYNCFKRLFVGLLPTVSKMNFPLIFEYQTTYWKNFDSLRILLCSSFIATFCWNYKIFITTNCWFITTCVTNSRKWLCDAICYHLYNDWTLVNKQLITTSSWCFNILRLCS